MLLITLLGAPLAMYLTCLVFCVCPPRRSQQSPRVQARGCRQGGAGKGGLHHAPQARAWKHPAPQQEGRALPHATACMQACSLCQVPCCSAAACISVGAHPLSLVATKRFALRPLRRGRLLRPRRTRRQDCLPRGPAIPGLPSYASRCWQLWRTPCCTGLACSRAAPPAQVHCTVRDMHSDKHNQHLHPKCRLGRSGLLHGMPMRTPVCLGLAL